MGWARALSAASLPLVLYGCVAQPVVLETGAPRGDITVRPGRAGFVVAAPHASSDSRTADIAAAIAQRTGFALVVATGPPAVAYEQRVQEAAQGRLGFYVEIHGSRQHDAAARIEVATVGMDAEFTQRLRALLELIRDAHVRARPGTPRLAVLMPAATTFSAPAAMRRDGVPELLTRALRVELPTVARTEARDAYTAILAEFLTQAATLPAGR